MSAWIVRTNAFKATPLEATVVQCLRGELVSKAIKTLFSFWGIAVLCVFIPVLHFFLVPLFLIIGIFFSIRTLKYKFTIRVGSFLCPECSKHNSIKNLWFAAEARFRCAHCAAQIVIDQKVL